MAPKLFLFMNMAPASVQFYTLIFSNNIGLELGSGLWLSSEFYLIWCFSPSKAKSRYSHFDTAFQAFFFSHRLKHFKMTEKN